MTGPGRPAAVTPIDRRAGEPVGERLGGPRVPADDALVRRLAGCCTHVSTQDDDRAEAGRDWWPLAIRWAAGGQVPALPGVVARPSSTAEVAAVLAACHDARVPVTPMAGRSGVCGGSIPVFGGVALDLCGLHGVTHLDTTSLTATVRAGTFGPDLERAVRAEGTTVGHWPQSMDLSTVGGWVACRGAGQYSTRYGKIEDMVTGLEVVLSDGRVVHTGGRAPRQATGPDLTQLFVGSEGTLGVVTEASLRLHPVPASQARSAFGFPDFTSGLEACRRILRRGATPAVLRLYDETETARHFAEEGLCALVVLDEADPGLLAATMAVVADESTASGGRRLADDLVEQWLARRNDVSALAPLTRAGIVVDTVEVAGRWAALPGLAERCLGALRAMPGMLAASVHQSHAYGDGACLYMTFAGRMPDTAGGHGDPIAEDRWAEELYTRAWQAVMDEVRDAGAAISHHHGIGLNRARFLGPALGPAAGVLADLKRALDPRGILNPGKLGMPSPFGEVPWP